MKYLNEMLCICFFCVFLSSLISANSELEESLIKNVKTLARLVERVSELEKQMKLLETSVFGDALNSEASSTVVKPNKIHHVTASIAKMEDGSIKFMLEHDFENVSHVGWTWNYVFISESMAKQIRLPGKEIMVIPHASINTEAGFRRAEIFIEAHSDVFSLDFHTKTATEFVEGSFVSLNGESVSESLKVFAPTIFPSKNIGYLPGEEIELKIDGRYRNDSEINWHFASISDNPDDDVATIYNSNEHNGFVNVSRDSEDDFTLGASINTTLLPNGGVMFLTESSDLQGELVSTFRSVQTLYFHLKTRKDPIPVNRVALEMEYFGNQEISLDTATSIGCVAYGNPTPQMEFREDGRRMDLEYTEWSWKYGNQISAAVTSDVLYHNISCYAKSGDDNVDLDIILSSPLTWVEEESKIRRITYNVIEVTCTIKGKPLPTIEFSLATETGGMLLHEDMDNVEISTARQGTTASSKLILDTSSITFLHQITCIGKRGSGETVKYFEIPKV